MTGREVMEWLAGQGPEVLDREVMVLDDAAECSYSMRELRCFDTAPGVMFAIDARVGFACTKPEDLAQ